METIEVACKYCGERINLIKPEWDLPEDHTYWLCNWCINKRNNGLI